MPSHTQAADMPNSPSQSATQAQPSLNQTALIQIRSSLSLQVAQTLPFPFNAKSSESSVQNAQVRLMTASTGAKSPLYVISTPLDKTAAASEGTSIWRFVIRPWDEQIDELVLKGKYSDGLALLDMLDDAQLLDKVRISELAVSVHHMTYSRTNAEPVFALSMPCRSSGRLNLTRPSTHSSTLTSTPRKWWHYTQNLLQVVYQYLRRAGSPCMGVPRLWMMNSRP